MRVYVLVNFVCEHKSGGHVGDVLKHDVLCDNLQGLNFQSTSGIEIFLSNVVVNLIELHVHFF